MSEDKSKRVPAKKAKNSAVDKVLNFFKNLPANIVKPFKNTWRELRKVTWPTRENLINSTLLVFTTDTKVYIHDIHKDESYNHMGLFYQRS